MNGQRIETALDKEWLEERFSLVSERIGQIAGREDSCDDAYAAYFAHVAGFLCDVIQTYADRNQLQTWSIEQLQEHQEKLYQDILPGHYARSFANPEYAKEVFPDSEAAEILCVLYGDLRSLIGATYEGRLYEIVIFMELFVQVFGLFQEWEDSDTEELRQTIQSFYEDYAEDILSIWMERRMDADRNFAVRILELTEGKEEKGLYLYGAYISETERKMHEYLATLSDEQIEELARPFTTGFYEGFAVNNVSFDGKKTVDIQYMIGFDRVIFAAIKQFRAMGLEPVIYREPDCSLYRKTGRRSGFYSAGANKQFVYDHQYDDAVYYTKSFVEKKLQAQRSAWESIRDLTAGYAGPAIVEVFGEKDFAPEAKKAAPGYNHRQQKYFLHYQTRAGQIGEEYLPGNSYSFTIISYPVPDIGGDFPEIFQETARVNTLPVDVYRQIQQHLIDALDSGEFVHIQGSGKNRTCLDIKLRRLEHPDTQTQFENCLADVNIPLGEVFTSPVLEGTKGVLHVPHVFLNDLEYHDLEIWIEDGMVTDYACANYSSEKENKKFIRDHILYQHDTLPMGEFAIGTNTRAYRMGRNYNIERKLPILIAEKTGPHFALGDTCYSHMEDVVTRNPDGKEIVAKDNSHSALRKTEPEKAYFNCHTDITIPYDELGCLQVIHADGTSVDIIRDGRFVLSGTEELNACLG